MAERPSAEPVLTAILVHNMHVTVHIVVDKGPGCPIFALLQGMVPWGQGAPHKWRDALCNERS